MGEIETPELPEYWWIEWNKEVGQYFARNSGVPPYADNLEKWKTKGLSSHNGKGQAIWTNFTTKKDPTFSGKRGEKITFAQFEISILKREPTPDPDIPAEDLSYLVEMFERLNIC